MFWTIFIGKINNSVLSELMEGSVSELLLCSTLYFPTDAHNIKKRRVIKTF
jgi:hypothetical protein